jgi:hypothetical protein
MTILPPNQFDSGVAPSSPDEAAVSSRSHAPGTAAEIPEAGPCGFEFEPTTDGGDTEEAPASTTVTVAAGDAGATDLIGEIFIGARKMGHWPGPFDPAAITDADEVFFQLLQQMDEPGTRDLPEIPEALWAEFDELPLFLQRAG